MTDAQYVIFSHTNVQQRTRPSVIALHLLYFSNPVLLC